MPSPSYQLLSCPPGVRLVPARRRITKDRQFELRPADQNLRRYLRNAVLPSIARHDRASPYFLPARGRRSHKNKLRVRIEPDRKIEQIRQYEPKAFDATTTAYHRNYIYGREGRPFVCKYYRHRAGEALVLEGGDCIAEDGFDNTPYPNNLDDTCRWVVERPFKTMQRAVHLAFPDTTRWWLDDAPPPIYTDEIANRDLWRTYLWRFHPDEHHETWWQEVPGSKSFETEPAPPESMVFIVQAPWILALKDMINVSECTKLPSFPDDEIPLESRLNSQQRVWAKLLDTCKHHGCHYFALTTYHGWLFGTFSEDWTSGRISELKEFNAKEPNVMQTLVYWVASSMGVVGTREELAVVGVEQTAGPSSSNGASGSSVR